MTAEAPRPPSVNASARLRTGFIADSFGNRNIHAPRVILTASGEVERCYGAPHGEAAARGDPFHTDNPLSKPVARIVARSSAMCGIPKTVEDFFLAAKCAIVA